MKDLSIPSNFDKQEFPLNCEKCKWLGYIFIDDLEKSYFVVCQKCRGETSNVWCPKCGMGGSFVKNIKRRPSTWSCPTCHTQYSLPTGFYENPITIYGLEELPPEIRERIRLAEAEAQPKFTLRRLLGFILIFTVVIALTVWPLAIFYTLDRIQHNGLWVWLAMATMLVWALYGLPRILQRMNALLMRIAKALNMS